MPRPVDVSANDSAATSRGAAGQAAGFEPLGSTMNERRQITVGGLVQGVGFRPFVHALAVKHGLAGFVLNDDTGVTIEVEGDSPAVENFFTALRRSPPPLARIERLGCRLITPRGERCFAIAASRVGDKRRAWIGPDTATCDDCLRELFTPHDRRYRYPFINCINCGPRFTIVTGVPYDRERTTMAAFCMCAECAREYHDSSGRRFHAQPNACPRCGPRVHLLDRRGEEIAAADPVRRAARLLHGGAILAVKGVGGYHLACNALDGDAVRRLRAGKHREEKPFALMVKDLNAARELCRLSREEEHLLRARARPIVLLHKREIPRVADAVAPGQRRLGLMLPYTPLHHLLLADSDAPLVMTSGNLSEEPIAYEDDDALRRLSPITDYLLVHEREIHTRCDDTVTQVMDRRERLIRRSRGYAPQPIPMSAPFVQPVLACGAHLKNTFCLGRGPHAFVSHHIGDLENYESLDAFMKGIEHFKKLFDIKPEVIAHDLHPAYLSTQYAAGVDGGAKIGVQHHHAHIASCMAEHDLQGPVIGVAFDGLGYGADGTIWGGEVLTVELHRFERRAHLRYVPMAGGDRAIREPWRMALSYLQDALGRNPRTLGLPGWDAIAEKNIEIVTAMMQRGLNTIHTSSCGRLFDAVASILGLRHVARYEGQAAVELEFASAGSVRENYAFAINGDDPWEIDMRLAIVEIVRAINKRTAASVVAAKFHNTLAAAIVDVCVKLRARDRLSRVVMSGGTFQNGYLLARVLPRLRNRGFAVYLNSKVPANDGGIALGQAVVANARVRRGDVDVFRDPG